MYKTTKALVLREVRYRDADKMLTVLTEDGSKLAVRAGGALRKTCKFAAAAQLLVCSEMTLFGSRDRWTLNEAETIEQFLPLRQDMGKLALGVYFAELLEAVSDADSPGGGLLSLGLNSLYALGLDRWSDSHVKAVFELRLMCLSGFTPSLDACPVCGNDGAEGTMFSLLGGCIHCPGCSPGAAGPSLPLSAPALRAARYIIAAPSKKIFSFEIPPGAALRLAAMTEAYTAAQLERGFSALEYWKELEKGKNEKP